MRLILQKGKQKPVDLPTGKQRIHRQFSKEQGVLCQRETIIYGCRILQLSAYVNVIFLDEMPTKLRQIVL